MMQGCIPAPATMRIVPTRAILTLAESERVRSLLRRRLAALHDGNVTALARELGLSQPQLSRTMNQAHGVSLATARALARIEGVDVESILSDPRTVAARICRGGRCPRVGDRARARGAGRRGSAPGVLLDLAHARVRGPLPRARPPRPQRLANHAGRARPPLARLLATSPTAATRRRQRRAAPGRARPIATWGGGVEVGRGVRFGRGVARFAHARIGARDWP